MQSSAGIGTITLLHAGVDRSLAWLLNDQIAHWDSMQCIGYEQTLERTVAMWRTLKPTVLFIDTCLDDTHGFDLCELVKKELPTQRIVFLADSASDLVVYSVAHRLTDALVWKVGNFWPELQASVASVLSGKVYVPDAFERARSALWSKPNAYFKVLSTWEISLLPLFGRGMRDTEIADKHARAEATIRGHRYEIIRRLGLHSTVELVRYAQTAGFTRALMPAPPCEWTKT